MVHLPAGLDAAATLDKHIEQLKKQRVAAALAAINKRHAPLAKGVGAAAAAAAGGDEEGDGDGGGERGGSSAAAAAAAAGHH